MNASVTEETIPTKKKLADLQEDYERLDDAVETEIRLLREERPLPASKFEELISKLALLLDRSSRKD
jgi:hypothetical protein